MTTKGVLLQPSSYGSNLIFFFPPDGSEQYHPLSHFGDYMKTLKSFAAWISSDLRAIALWVILPVLSVGGRTPGMSSWPETMILGGSRCMMGLRAGCGWREYSS